MVKVVIPHAPDVCGSTPGLKTPVPVIPAGILVTVTVPVGAAIGTLLKRTPAWPIWSWIPFSTLTLMMVGWPGPFTKSPAAFPIEVVIWKKGLSFATVNLMGEAADLL